MAYPRTGSRARSPIPVPSPSGTARSWPFNRGGTPPRIRQARFVLVTLGAVVLALLVGMYLEIDAPYWAATTVLIIANPVRAQVTQKSSARILGSVAGAVAGVALIAWFAQAPPFFVSGLGLWMAACTAMSTRYRAFHAYGWVLAGYTAAIIAVPSVEQPDRVFAVALSRLSAVAIGLGSFGLLNTVLGAPGTARAAFVRRFSAVRAELFGWAAARIADLDRVPPRPVPLRPALIADILALEVLAAELATENRELRREASRLRGAIAALLSIYPMTLSLPVVPAPADRADDPELPGRLRRLATLLEAAAGSGARRDALRMAMSLRRIDGGAMPTRQLRLRMARIARAIAETDTAAILAAGDRARGGTTLPVTHTTDWHDTFRSGARCLAAVVAAGGIWIVTAWPDGGTFLLITAIMVSLYSTRPAPRQASRKAVTAVLVSSGVAGVLKFGLLTEVGDAPQLLFLVIGPVVAAGAAAILHPRLAGYAATFNFLMLTQMEVRNVMDYDFGAFINAAVATVAGVAMASAWFDILPIEAAPARAERLLRAMRRAALSLATLPRARADNTIARLHGYLAQILPTLDEAGRVRAGAALQLALALAHLRLLLRPPRGLGSTATASCHRALRDLPDQTRLRVAEAALARDPGTGNAAMAALLALEDIRLCLDRLR